MQSEIDKLNAAAAEMKAIRDAMDAMMDRLAVLEAEVVVIKARISKQVEAKVKHDNYDYRIPRGGGYGCGWEG